jgi:hypothetical protein
MKRKTKRVLVPSATNLTLEYSHNQSKSLSKAQQLVTLPDSRPLLNSDSGATLDSSYHQSGVSRQTRKS